MKRNTKRLILSIVIVVIGIFMKVSILIDSFPSWLGAAGIPIMVFGIFLALSSFRWNHTDHVSFKPLPPIDDARKIELLYLDGLTSENDKILRLFYHENGRERIVIYQRPDHLFSYCKEYLTFFDEEEMRYCTAYGSWIDVSDRVGLFEDETLVMRELKEELSDYHEIEIPHGI